MNKSRSKVISITFDLWALAGLLDASLVRLLPLDVSAPMVTRSALKFIRKNVWFELSSDGFLAPHLIVALLLASVEVLEVL